MDITEDEEIYIQSDYVPPKKPEKKPEEPPETKPETPENKKDNPGTRIIYQAPEGGEKRKFTGFKDLMDEGKENGDIDEEEITLPDKPSPARKNSQAFRQSVRARYSSSVIKPNEVEEEEIEIDESEKKADNDTDIIIDEEVDEIIIGDDRPPVKKSTGDKIRKIVLALSIIVMIVSAGFIANHFIQIERNKQWEDEMSNLTLPDITEEQPTKKSKKKKTNTEEESTTETTRPLTIEEQWAKLRQDYPNVVFPDGLSLKYAKMYAINQDFVGYVSIDEFGIGLPVVQSQKDTATENYYLRRNFYKNYSVYGCPFVSKTQNMNPLDRNTVVYGHNNNSNLAFAPLSKYKTTDGFKKAPVIQFDTLYGNYKWKIIAAFIINVKASDDNGYVFDYTFTQLESSEKFAEYINFLRRRSLYDTGVDVVTTDKILTLSTCTHDFEDARFVVVARMVRPGESEYVDTSKVKVNANPQYPQAYYTAKKKKNPYKDAVNWYY